MRHRPHQRVAPRPHVEGRNVVREVDDRRARGPGRDHGVHHAGELVLRCRSRRGRRRCGTGSLVMGTVAQRCRLRDRSVAAATASMKAERTARASSARMPAAVVPAGEVTMARSASGSRPVSCKQGGRAQHRLDHERPAHLAGQAHLHARLDERLGDEEEVGRARPREPGDRIEQALGQADDRARRPTGRPRPRPGRARWRRTRPTIAVTPAPTRAGVLGMARTTAGSPPSAASRRGAGHAGHDGEQPASRPVDPEGAAGRLRRVGLHRQHGAARSARRRRRAARARAPPRRAGPGYSAASSSRRSATGSTTVTSSTPAHPERSSPPSRAPPIFPPPTMSRLDTRATLQRSAGRSAARPAGAAQRRGRRR